VREETEREKSQGRTNWATGYVRNEIEAGGGDRGGIAREPQKNEHMSEIQLNPQGGRDRTRHTIIERAINTRLGEIWKRKASNR
jgi:hypothetical protein